MEFQHSVGFQQNPLELMEEGKVLHIFTSPSTALKAMAGYAATKDCQAKLHGMMHVTPRSIAYAAMHVSFCFELKFW